MSDINRRLDRLARAHEWDTAMVSIDRLLEWALATKRVELIEAAGIRLHILAAAPTRAEFASEKWSPEPASPEDIEAGREFGREVDAWHRDQQ